MITTQNALETIKNNGYSEVTADIVTLTLTPDDDTKTITTYRRI
ncbi:MAG: hypothetical protein WC357_06200 [Candidatus Omnitrophota bacterium]|jgi:hypothetical protein